ncbi:MAG: hypothetical protein IJ930_08990 [Lachnospiraceae bacterium]|nr:hypothetical protein [Lachnospiraceae bacterium]
MKTGRIWAIALAALMLCTAAAAAGCAAKKDKDNGTGADTAAALTEPIEEAAEETAEETAAPAGNGSGDTEAVPAPAAEDGRVYAPGPYGRISVMIPEGWESRTVAAGESGLDTGGFYGLLFFPESRAEGRIELSYQDLFGVCGTGLTQEEVQIAGSKALIGTYDDGIDDNDRTWDFITFHDDKEGIVAIANMTMDWTGEEKEKAKEILETLVFEPDIREGGIGYFRRDSEIPEIGLMMQARDIRADGATVRFSLWDPDAADGELIYGEDFALEKQDGEFYKELPPVIDNAAFNDIGYTILPDTDNDWAVNWKWLYGEIEPGEYRIRKSVSAWRAPGDFDRYDIYAYFIYAGEPAGKAKENAEAADEEAGDHAGQDAEGVEKTVAVLPDAAAPDMDAEAFLMTDAHWKWWQAQLEKINASAELQAGMEDYYAAILKEMLQAEDEEGHPANAVCSPLNIYTALAMLAEVSGGNTREQILDALQVEDIESAREKAKAFWEANYADTPALKSIPAASMWLNDRIGYHPDTLQRLAEDHHASSFMGVPGSEEMDKALRQWTDDNTGGLLTEYTQDLKLDRDTVLALVTTIYYKAAWTDRFAADRTKDEIFHGASGDREVPMMHMDRMMGIFPGSCFTAAGLSLTDSGNMYFFLPDEGISVQDLASGEVLREVLKVSRAAWEAESYYPIVHLSLPKFSVSAKTGLISILKDLGIQDAMIPGIADFGPLTDEVDEIYLSEASHAALVEIDEEGVTGAAYTELAMAAGAAMPQDEIDLVFDRPFLFTVTARDGSVLFAGIVQNAK